MVNILQKDMFPQDVDTEIRRGCYAICLQLARSVKKLPFWPLCRIFVYLVFTFCLFVCVVVNGYMWLLVFPALCLKGTQVLKRIVPKRL